MRRFWHPALIFSLFSVLSLSLLGCATTGAKAPQHVYRLRVEAGDSLTTIAMKYDTTWEKIAKLNHLTPGQALVPGTILRVEPGPGGVVAKPKILTGSESDDEDAAEGSAGNGAYHGRRGLLFGGSSGRGHLEWPLYGELSSPYGKRHGRFHHGIDIRAKTGSTVLAAAPGVVEFAGQQRGYGKVVIVRHKRFKTLYGHLGTIKVAVGAKVTHASELGASGKSGNSTGPHLHFEIRTIKGESIDPLSVMEKDRLLSSRD